MTKILVIAYFFPPLGGAGVQRAKSFVSQLPDEGFLPIVVTGSGLDENRWTPIDRTLLDQLPSNIPIHRVLQSPPSGRWSRARRLRRLLSLREPFSQWWIRHGTDVAMQAANDARLILATMSPFESAEIAERISRRFRIPWIADLRDPWALDEIQVFPSMLHRRMEMGRMRRLLSSASLIIMNTREATAAIKANYPELSSKTVTITNGFARDDFAGDPVARNDAGFRIVHTGYLHTELGLDARKRLYRWLGGSAPGIDILTRSHVVLLRAVERWCAEEPRIRDEVEIVLAGRASHHDRLLSESSSISSLIRLTGYLDHATSIQLARTADLLFLPMHNLPPGLRTRIVPAKSYEYMATGRPILAAVPEGDAHDLLQRCGTAFMCRPDDSEAMVAILRNVHAAWKAGRCLVTSNQDFVNEFERRRLTSLLASRFRDVLSRTTVATS
jgi:glycosyltransferase involved in cell wall biosynthesis